jgi:hypothetical protein
MRFERFMILLQAIIYPNQRCLEVLLYNPHMTMTRRLLLLCCTPEAKRYYAALLAMTGDGAQSSRPELAHAKKSLQ